MLSKDGWVPMFPQPANPPVTNSNVASSNVFGPSVATTVNEEDIVSSDYGSSEDEESVVVRPYEVPNQVTPPIIFLIV